MSVKVIPFSMCPASNCLSSWSMATLDMWPRVAALPPTAQRKNQVWQKTGREAKGPVERKALSLLSLFSRLLD